MVNPILRRNTTPNGHGLGYIPDLPDMRDYPVTDTFKLTTPVILPAKVDLRGGMPEVWDQGALGSCTAHAVGSAYSYERRREAQTVFMPSRLMIYYFTRSLEGTIKSDSGGSLRDAMKVLAKFGAAPEELWPYHISRFSVGPTYAARTEAAKHKTITYYAVRQTLTDLKMCLAQSLVIPFGFSVYESFETPDVAATGMVPYPKLGERLLGGHAVTLVGYDNALSAFLVRNSWGPGWGQGGYCWMGYDYICSPLASDFWTLSLVTN